MPMYDGYSKFSTLDFLVFCKHFRVRSSYTELFWFFAYLLHFLSFENVMFFRM